ncbi:MAG: alpha-1,2-fucosyltransferase [Bacteroidota bacterium]
MIVVKLIGGLGNQMFQYAAGKALAHRHGVSLKLDVTGFDKATEGAYTQRHFELGCFKLQTEIATEAELKRFTRFEENRWLRVAQRKMPWLFSNTFFSESGSQFHETFLKLGANTYMNGYWQSELYFNDIRKILLQDFELNETMPKTLDHWFNKIQTINSVSMHVRRGDYVQLASANAFHGICSELYYQNALSKLQLDEKNVEIFVFSDDINWCKENLKFKTKTHFVDHAEKACWDLFLMRHCKHNIIANSSFSWWAAWLNEHTNKRVFVPEYWFTNIKSDSIDILAHHWESVK